MTIKMNFRNARARQPEIVRSVQKDLIYTNELTGELSDLLRLTGNRNWIKYNHMCKLLAEISYHGFASLNSLQTLGEEYTGIIQVDAEFKNIPSRLLQLMAIILEFGGEALYMRLLQKVEIHIKDNDEFIPEAKQNLLKIIKIMRSSTTFIKALHKSLFYIQADKYQISKRITGINYVLIRHWLQPEFSLYGYKILGIITFLQVAVSLSISSFEFWRDYKRKQFDSNSMDVTNLDDATDADKRNPNEQCALCLEGRIYTSITPCGHLFCWSCIMNWLDERDECPLCRETVKKSTVIQLRNYM